ncbi:hypothetical protein VNO77_22826 [Canavalia gladiata]|uniref:Uncharacterized protein n=1 Tax=Canavalia gladiata TaxID=3824 RepID=A0AAN9L3U2_CANGL
MHESCKEERGQYLQSRKPSQSELSGQQQSAPSFQLRASFGVVPVGVVRSNSSLGGGLGSSFFLGVSIYGYDEIQTHPYHTPLHDQGALCPKH